MPAWALLNRNVRGSVHCLCCREIIEFIGDDMFLMWNWIVFGQWSDMCALSSRDVHNDGRDDKVHVVWEWTVPG